jgi:hypothetical protein
MTTSHSHWFVVGAVAASYRLAKGAVSTLYMESLNRISILTDITKYSGSYAEGHRGVFGNKD